MNSGLVLPLLSTWCLSFSSLLSFNDPSSNLHMIYSYEWNFVVPPFYLLTWQCSWKFRTLIPFGVKPSCSLNPISPSTVQSDIEKKSVLVDKIFGLRWEKIWEKVMAPHSSTLVWKIPWAEEPGRLQSMGSQRVGHDWATSLSLSLSCIGERNSNPFQCSCLENPRDGGAWWAAVYGVVQSRTRLKWLSSREKI